VTTGGATALQQSATCRGTSAEAHACLIVCEQSPCHMSLPPHAGWVCSENETQGYCMVGRGTGTKKKDSAIEVEPTRDLWIARW